MPKLDLRKTLKHLYRPSAKDFSIVDVPPLSYLMMDGHGDPNTAPAYAQAVQALYSVAYTLKFQLKQADPALDFGVMPLEGLWWAADMANFTQLSKADWDWTMLILQPDFVTAGHVAAAQAAALRKKGAPGVERVRLETYHEGPAAQIRYFGAYADEGPTIARLHAFIAAQGRRLSGKHHEVYLGDPRRTAPAKLQTVIRQPFAR
ncbi:MAG: GyrI-like domain-containing protein [Anaerolineales bacterium]|nr:GyrI-like domain-containing protein [Anaerolineales bacterium]